MTLAISRRASALATLLLGALLLSAPASAQPTQRPGAPAGQQGGGQPTSGPGQRGADQNQEPARAAGKVNVQLMVVYATQSSTAVDPRLGSLTRYLKNLRYSGYELLDSHVASLSVNGSETVNVEGGRQVILTLLNRDDQKARMRVEITAKTGRLLDTTLTVNRNGTFIVAGPKYKDGILVLPLTAKY